MRTKQISLIALGFLLLSMTTVAVAWMHHEHSVTVGKKGEITRPTKAVHEILRAPRD